MRGALCIFLRESYTYKLRSDLNITPDAIKCLCIEIISKHSKNLILNLSDRPLQGDTTLLEKHWEDLLLRHDVCKKEDLITRYFKSNEKVQSFVNLTFRCGMVPTISKPTRITRYNATAVDLKFTNSIIYKH